MKENQIEVAKNVCRQKLTNDTKKIHAATKHKITLSWPYMIHKVLQKLKP